MSLPPHEARTPRLSAQAALGLVLLVATGAGVASYVAGLSQPIGDELDVVRPALDHAHGIISHRVKYPSFPFHFYAFWFRVAGTLENQDASLAVARVVNAALFGLATVLFYLFVSRLVRRSVAVLGAVLFVSTPVICLTAPLVKTEALLMVELLGMLLALERLRENPNDLLLHYVAGACAALSITTKLSIYPTLLYGCAWVYAWRSGARVSWSATLCFVGVFLGTIALTGTNLPLLPQMLDYWQDDHYFQPNASPLRAIPGLTSFPHDRYSSFFYTTLPLAVGWPLIAFALLSTRQAIHRGWFGNVVGLGTLLALLVALNATLLRITHSFLTLYTWVLVVACLSVERSFTKGRWHTRGALALALACVLYGAWNGSQMSDTYPDRVLAERVHDPQAMLFFTSRTRVPDSETVRARVERERPETIVALNSYFMNLCRYGDHPLYADGCAYFDELLDGRAGYEIIDEIPFNSPGSQAQLDPEVRLARFYVLRRVEPRPAPPAPAPPAPGPSR